MRNVLKLGLYDFVFAAIPILIGILTLRRSNPVSLTESALHIVIAGAFITVAPGWVLRRLLRLTKSDILSEIPLAFLWSATVIVFNAFICFVFKLPISIWSWCLLLETAVLWIGLAFRDWRLLVPNLRTRPLAFEIFPILAMAIVLYRWGTDITHPGGDEVGLHLTFIREYASGLLLDFLLSTPRGAAFSPPNLFFFWEFLMAAISDLARVDCLVVTLRSRWFIPVFGLTAWYLLVREWMGSIILARGSLVVLIIGCVTGLFLCEPNLWAAVGVEAPIRGLTLFMGSVHHGDVAMEIAFPVALAMFFRFRRIPTVVRGTEFTMAALLCFLWHPREFFQILVTVSLAGLIDLLFAKHRSPTKSIRSIFTKIYAPLLAGLLLIAGFFATAGKFLAAGEWEHAGEMNLKITIVKEIWGRLRDIKFWGAFELPLVLSFSGPSTILSDVFTERYVQNLVSLILACFFAIPLFFRPRLRPIRLMAFMTAFLFVLFVWGPPQYVVRLLTYSEMLDSKLRFSYLLLYVMMSVNFIYALEWLTTLQVFRNRLRIFIVGVCALIGAICGGVWEIFRHQLLPVAVGLSVMILFVQWGLTFKSLDLRVSGRDLAPKPNLALVGWCFLALTLPISFGTAKRIFGATFSYEDVTEKQINPYHFSASLISFLRVSPKPRSMFLVNPGYDGDQTAMLPMYGPVYQTPITSAVYMDWPSFALARENTHPYFNSSVAGGKIDHTAVDFLIRSRANYLFLRRTFYESGRILTKSFAAHFRVAFENTESREIVIEIL